jgi:hypothetical protein
VMYSIYDYLEQTPLSANTVFNFFQPDYQPDGDLKNAGKYAPEFQMLNSQTLTNYFNALNRWLINDEITTYWDYFPAEKNKTDEHSHFAIDGDFVLTKDSRLTELIDKYNLILAHGRLSATSVAAIKTAIMAMPYSEDANGVPDQYEAYRRLRIALYLIMSSPDYLINR